MFGKLRRFARGVGGAVTADYVPLIAGIIGLGSVVVGSIGSGVIGAGESIGQQTAEFELGSGGELAGDPNGGGAEGGNGSWIDPVEPPPPSPPGDGAAGGTPGNPGNDKGVGNAGETPNGGGDWGGGSGGMSDGGDGGGGSGGGGGNGSGNGGGGGDGAGGGNGYGGGNGNGGGNGPGGNGNGGGAGSGNGNGNGGGAGGNGNGNGNGGGNGHGGDDGEDDDGANGIPDAPDFVLPDQTLSAGWGSTVTSPWFALPGSIPVAGPAAFRVWGDGNPTLRASNGQRSAEGVLSSGTNIVIDVPACGTTSTVVIEVGGLIGVWQVVRPEWPANWGTPPAGC